MKVWVDVLTPKQVLFFAPVIRELRRRGAEVFATSRKYREIGPIAKIAGLGLEYVGERGGATPEEQLIAATRRQTAMIPLIRRFRPDVALSVASAVCARIAFGMRVGHVAVNDSPHSVVAARLSLPLTRRLLCPWIIPYEAWAPFGLRRSEITRYRALDPAAWLKRSSKRGPVPDTDGSKLTITVRLEESYAPYMEGSDRSLSYGVLKELARGFPGENLVVLCRYGDQLEGVRRKFGRKLIVPETVVDGRSLLGKTDVFVGMGGTMTAESALMGVPTISMFQGELYTEKYLRTEALLRRPRAPSELVRVVSSLLDGRTRSRIKSKAARVLARMEDPVPTVVRRVEAVSKQA